MARVAHRMIERMFPSVAQDTAVPIPGTPTQRQPPTVIDADELAWIQDLDGRVLAALERGEFDDLVSDDE